MKPWVLLLKMSICGIVMLLPVLGGVRNFGVWWGRRVFCPGLGSWPLVPGHNWFRAQFPDSPFKGSEPFLKQRHPRKIRLDVPNLASLQAPSPRSENNIGYMERQCSFCLHFISSQEMIFSNARPPWAAETPAQSFSLSPYFQNLCAWPEWAFDEYKKGNILTHSFSLRGKIF